MITFFEKPSFETSVAFSKMVLVPVFMVKDGTEYFVKNRTISGGSFSPEFYLREIEAIKGQLLSANGVYFKLHGVHDNPLDMLREMEKRKHSFDNPNLNRLFADYGSEAYGAGFVDFGGNRSEVSAAFQYRIYDKAFAEELRAQVKKLISSGKSLKRKKLRGGGADA